MKFCIAWEGQSYEFKMFTMNAANHSVQHTLMHNKLATDMTMNLIALFHDDVCKNKLGCGRSGGVGEQLLCEY